MRMKFVCSRLNEPFAKVVNLKSLFCETVNRIDVPVNRMLFIIFTFSYKLTGIVLKYY